MVVLPLVPEQALRERRAQQEPQARRALSEPVQPVPQALPVAQQPLEEPQPQLAALPQPWAGQPQRSVEPQPLPEERPPPLVASQPLPHYF